MPRLEIGGAKIGDCRALFPFAPNEVWLEIGFGGAEHLLAQARTRRDVGFIGCEPFLDGVAKALAGVEEHALDNVRLRAGDAAALIAGLPDGCLSHVCILYPDPWPKRRQHKRRLISQEMVDELRAGGAARRGELARDIDNFGGSTCAVCSASAEFDWLARQADELAPPVGKLAGDPL